MAYFTVSLTGSLEKLPWISGLKYDPAFADQVDQALGGANLQ